jgi:hypothetical protein
VKAESWRSSPSSSSPEQLGRRIVITDNEFDEWSGGGVNVIGSHNATTPND